MGYAFCRRTRGAYKTYDIVPCCPYRLQTAAAVLVSACAELRAWELFDAAAEVEQWTPETLRKDTVTYVYDDGETHDGQLWYILPVQVPRAVIDAAASEVES